MKQNRKLSQMAQTVGTFALGATAGSILALLFAPAPGRVIRKRIGMKMRALEHSAGRSIKQAKKLLVKKAGDLREVATEKIGESRQWLLEHISNGNGKRPAARRLVHHA